MKRKIIFAIVCVFLCIENFSFVSAEELGVLNTELAPVKLFDIEKTEGYQGLQGMIVTDKHIVVAAVKNDNSETLLQAYDKTTYELVRSVTSNHYGHANDMAYDEVEQTITIINNQNLYVLDANTLVEEKEITLPRSMSAITYFNGFYLLRDDTSFYSYDGENLTDLEIHVSNDYAKQGISSLDNDIFCSAYVATADDNFEAGMSVVFLYNISGLQRTYSFSESLGELQALEFDVATPYLLFQTSDGNGGIYSFSYTPISTSLEIDVQSGTLNDMSNVVQAQLTNDEGSTVSTVSNNNKYIFSNLTFTEPGNYHYDVHQLFPEDTDIIYDDDTIDVEIQVRFNFIDNALYISDVVYGEKKYFQNEQRLANPICEVKDGIYYNESGMEVSEEEFVSSCGVVENPQTGGFVPILLLAIGGLLGTMIVFCLKNKLYHL